MTEQGGQEAAGVAGGVGDNQAGAAGDVTSEAKYSDADLNKYKGTARKEGRQALANDLLSRAQGAQSVDDLVTAWEEKRTIEEATKGETEREREARIAVEQERDEYRALADTRLVDSELRLAFLNAGVPPDRVADAVALVARSSISVDGDSVAGLEDAVKATLEPRSWLTETQQEVQAPRRAADVSQRTVPASSDPQQQHANFLASLLGNNSGSP